MPDFAELLRRLQRGDARVLQRAPEDVLSRFAANRCHANVAKWIEDHPGQRHVRGWLVTEDFGVYFLDGHSVVGVGSDLLDITPSRFALKFLPHEGTPEEFNLLPPQITLRSS